ncbi:MAG: pyridoxal-phosphate dependent enzyme [Roseobacter sp.]|nr:pyridoxal-phosphate dependent enzyme [Roseobacter sp.]
MKLIENPFLGQGLNDVSLAGIPMPSVEAAAPRALLARCPEAGATPLVALGPFAGAGAVFVKDERARMGLGSFKALGAAYVIASEAAAGRAAGQVFVCASAGNHGLSVAAGAQAFKARTVIYLSRAVPEAFAERLRARGAEVRRVEGSYEQSMEAAAKAAQEEGFTLLSDSSWEGYTDYPHRLMEGYLVMAAEAGEAMAEPPTHIFLQAGVGGLAAACAAYFRKIWGADVQIVVVEPEAAPALKDCIAAGRFVAASGPQSCMGRLDCKEASLIALNGLARDASAFMTISEAQSVAALQPLADVGLETTPSGGAGLAGLMSLAPLGPEARVLCIVSEGPEA